MAGCAKLSILLQTVAITSIYKPARYSKKLVKLNMKLIFWGNQMKMTLVLKK